MILEGVGVTDCWYVGDCVVDVPIDEGNIPVIELSRPITDSGVGNIA